eukprot:198693_1
MGRQKPRVVMNLSQNHKQFKQRVHILNSALSNQTTIKTRNHNKIDEESFISLQTKNSNTFTPNLMECILFPIFTTAHSQSPSSQSIQLITKHTQLSNNKQKKKKKKNSKQSGSTNNFSLNFDINPRVYVKTTKNWQSQLLVQQIEDTLQQHMQQEHKEIDTDIYIAPSVRERWPSTYGTHNQYLNPNIAAITKESPYDVLMLRCAQRCFSDILLNEFSFDDFVHLIETRYNYYYWSYHEDNTTNIKKRKIHFNKHIAQLCRQINGEISKAYAVFMDKEMEFRLQIVMGNKKLLKQERGAHIASLSVFAVQKSVESIANVISEIDSQMQQIHSVAANIILKWTQNIRFCIGTAQSVLKDIKQLKYIVIQHLYQFGEKFDKYLRDIECKMNEKRRREGVEMVKQTNANDMALIYIYETAEDGGKKKNAYEVHLDMELCDFGAYLNYYRYILTVIEECRTVISNEYETQLNHLLKYVGGEIEGSIWWRQIWEEREYEHRVKKDEQIAKKLLFLGGNKELTESVMEKYQMGDVMSGERMGDIYRLQESMIAYVRQILNHNEVEITTLAIHIKLNLLNNNEFVRQHLLSKMYQIIHDRDRPRGPKPEKTLKKIREKAKLLLLKKEEAEKRKKKKRIRIQTSAKHLQKLANVAPSASDIQKKYHESILKQRSLISQQRKRKLEAILERRRRRKKKDSAPPAPPALEGFLINEPPKKRRKSSRIESFGERRTYIEPEIEEYVTYQFEFAIVSSWNEFLQSDLVRKYKKDMAADEDALSLLFVGLHLDIEDEYHEWYEGIIQKVRITAKKAREDESDAKTQSTAAASNDDDDAYNIKLLIHFKNFSTFWDSWVELPSSRVSVLRTYSNAYDVHDNVKPLAEIIRELDEAQIVSIDFISESLSLERDVFVKWINSEPVQWQDTNTVDKLLEWTKHFLLSNKTSTDEKLMISRDYFVKAGTYSSKCEHMICEAVLPNTLDVNLQCLTSTQMQFIQDTVISNLKHNKCDYFTMSNQCGIPLGLFQQIVFGITDLLPRFIVDQVVDWAKGIHLDNLDHAIKEEQLFYVKIE